MLNLGIQQSILIELSELADLPVPKDVGSNSTEMNDQKKYHHECGLGFLFDELSIARRVDETNYDRGDGLHLVNGSDVGGHIRVLHDVHSTNLLKFHFV